MKKGTAREVLNVQPSGHYSKKQTVAHHNIIILNINTLTYILILSCREKRMEIDFACF